MLSQLTERRRVPKYIILQLYCLYITIIATGYAGNTIVQAPF